MTGKSFPKIAENYKRVIENIENAKIKAGRCDEVRVMAVTKTVEAGRINSAIESGIGLLGENRVQEFLQKREDYQKNCEIHFIGGLQNNKVKYIIDKVSMIHSVDSVKLSEEINRRASLNDVIMDILVEVNIAGEATKHGVAPNETDELIEKVRGLSSIRVRGLMVIPPIDDNGSSVGCFERTQRLFEDIRGRLKESSFDTLSMGMSGDYETAVLYGANIVRLGSALFGYRR